MTKKITRLEDFIPASDAADLLSQKLDRPIDPKYIRLLAKRKKILFEQSRRVIDGFTIESIFWQQTSSRKGNK